MNQDVLYVRFAYSKMVRRDNPNINVVLAAYTTCMARLHLSSLMNPLGERIIYVDTDSIIFVTRDNWYEPLPGPLLGELTDELVSYGEGSYITSFVSGGPKFYSFTVRKPDGGSCSVCKVKGIRLYFENSRKIHYDSVRTLIERDSEIEVGETAIRRTCFHDVISKRETKIVKPVYTKRWFLNKSQSYPYGFNNL